VAAKPERGGEMMRLGALAALWILACPAAATSQVLRQGEFLQDYVTCEAWMKRGSTDAEMHDLIGRWVVDAMRQSSPSRLSKYGDGEILEVVERQCQAQPAKTLTVVTFLAGLRLPE
jgi:hypothetical protein